MTRYNMGCGNDIRQGYTNCDFINETRDSRFHLDMSQFPWPIQSDDAEEVLLLDVLEHFPYAQTEQVLQEVWRILKPGGFVDIQCPDFEECARAMLSTTASRHVRDYHCNNCGFFMTTKSGDDCEKCGQSRDRIAQAAMNRLYGGQDRKGNWHYAAFTQRSISLLLQRNGFERLEFATTNQNGESYLQNWNFRVRAFKRQELW